MPYTNSPILRTCDNNRKFWMETNSRHIVRMTFKCLNATFGLIVPHLFSYDLMKCLPFGSNEKWVTK